MKRVVIYRHPECRRCARFARVHHALDWLGRLATSTDVPPGGPLVPGRIAVVDLATRRRVGGAEAFALICRQVPAYWPLLALLGIPAARRRFAREFDPGATEGCQPAPGGAHPLS
mgnify:CR=1 FL=1